MPEGTVGPLYCSEQIRIPEKLPEIMKNYCKAAIKTQPYDILKWSTAYFRSLADDLPPVMKTCLEKETRTKYLTKGCLRMFVEHLGKGFFVHRRILKKLWEKVLPLVTFKILLTNDENLILDEFYKVISLGRMLYWRELHWLKLIGIMAGWLSKDLRSTMMLICDLLTNELEGGVSSIPIWMFLTIYKYLAELDCSTAQRIINSRRQLEDGTVEDLIEPNELPYIMSATSLNKCLIESCVDVDEQCSQSNSSYEDDDTVAADIGSSEDLERKEWLKDFKMHGKIAHPARIFKRCQNFDTLIFYIKTHQIKNQCQVIQGPHHIKAKTASKARDKDYDAAITREQFDTIYKETVAYEEAFQDKIDIIKDSGPPWSWIFDFTACSGYDKSFNYLDNISILSDKTPDTSSDESFDFLTEKPITHCVNVYKPDTSSIKSASTYQSSCDEKNISELLISRSKECLQKPISSVVIHESDKDLYKKTETKTDTDQTTQVMKKTPLYQFEAVVTEFETLLREPHLEYDSSDDGNSYHLPNLESILRQAGDKSEYSVEYMFIVDIMKIAMRQEIKFNTLDEVLKYIRTEYNKWFKKEDENKKPDEPCVPTETDTDTDRNWVMNENVSQVFEESSLKAYNFGTGDYQGSHADQRECKEDNKPKQIETPPQPKTPVPQEEKPKRNIENTFGDDITMDQKVKSRKVQKDMILGLVSGGSESEDTTSINNSSSSIISDPPKCIDKTGYYSDDSSIFPKPTIEKDKRIKYQEYKQTCELPREHEKIYDYKIPHLPGIGGIVSYKVMCKFMEFIKFCAYKQQGMVFKSNLLEEKCPPLEDLLQFTNDENPEHKMQQESVECASNKVETIEERCPEP